MTTTTVHDYIHPGNDPGGPVIVDVDHPTPYVVVAVYRRATARRESETGGESEPVSPSGYPWESLNVTNVYTSEDGRPIKVGFNAVKGYLYRVVVVG